MTTLTLDKRLGILLAASLLLSCGGGGGSASGGGIDGTGRVSQGPISAFGSIVVNGTAFDTTAAQVILDGESAGSGDQVVADYLKIGMVVIVEGNGDETDTAAERIYYNESLHGPVQSIRSIDSTTSEISVLGQSVIINALTQFEGTEFDALSRDDVISVSGFFDDQGAIRATYLERMGTVIPGTVYEVSGHVRELDPQRWTFNINALTVDYSDAVVVLPGADLTDDLYVEAEGTLDSNGFLHAVRIEPGDTLEARQADEIEVIGFVTKRVSGFEFSVGNQLVRVNQDAEFVDGTPADAVPGAKLEAEGRLQNGILIAHEVEFWGPDQVEVEDLVTDVASPAEFTLGSQVIQTTSETVFENGTAEDLAVGLRMEVKGVPMDLQFSVIIADKVSFEED